MKITHAVDYRKKRIEDYPDIGDQLDALWKQLAVSREGGALLVPSADLMLNRIIEVKERYQKP